MITGDHPQTARAIARQIGLPADSGVLTGAELDALQEAAYTKRLGTQITAREFRNMAAAWVNNKRRKALDDDGMQA